MKKLRAIAAVLSVAVCLSAPAQKVTVEDRIRTFTGTRDPEDLRKALTALKSQFWDTPIVANQQGGTQRSVRKLDAQHEVEMLPWFEFYAALDNVEAAMRAGNMPMPLTHDPEPASRMDAKQQSAYEEALLQNADARKHWAALAEFTRVRHDASSFLWLIAGGVLHDDPDLQQRVEYQALQADCLPARAKWLRSVVGAAKGTFAPPDDSIGKEKPVKHDMELGFPQYAEFKDADPNVTHDVTSSVPTRILASREQGHLVLRFDPNSFQKVTLKVGRQMFTGIQLDEIIQQPGKPRETAATELSSSIVFDDNLRGEETMLPKGAKLIGLQVKIFETDTPPQHIWMPSPYVAKYRVLWSKEMLATH